MRRLLLVLTVIAVSYCRVHSGDGTRGTRRNIHGSSSEEDSHVGKDENASRQGVLSLPSYLQKVSNDARLEYFKIFENKTLNSAQQKQAIQEWASRHNLAAQMEGSNAGKNGQVASGGSFGSGKRQGFDGYGQSNGFGSGSRGGFGGFAGMGGQGGLGQFGNTGQPVRPGNMGGQQGVEGYYGNVNGYGFGGYGQNSGSGMGGGGGFGGFGGGGGRGGPQTSGNTGQSMLPGSAGGQGSVRGSFGTGYGGGFGGYGQSSGFGTYGPGGMGGRGGFGQSGNSQGTMGMAPGGMIIPQGQYGGAYGSGGSYGYW